MSDHPHREFSYRVTESSDQKEFLVKTRLHKLNGKPDEDV